MKIIFYSLFFLTSFSFSQTINGIITFNPIKGIGGDTELSEKIKKPMVYDYTYSNKVSKQELISKHMTTVKTIFLDENAPFETQNVSIVPSKVIFYKNYNSDIFRLESSKKNVNLIEENTSVEDDIPKYDWVLENDTQTIVGHLCKKATTKKYIGSRIQKITAWYSENLPIDDGPMDFNGLPGLILQIEIDDISIVKFEKLEIIENKTIEIVAPENKTKTITLSDFYKKSLSNN